MQPTPVAPTTIQLVPSLATRAHSPRFTVWIVTAAGFFLYANIGTTVAGGTVDLYLYGYDTSVLS